MSLSGLISNHFRQKIPQLFNIHQRSGFIIHHSLRACCILQQAQRVEIVYCRGDHWSSTDFAKAKSVAARRKHGYFPSRNSKNYVFRRTSDARPYNLNLKIRFIDSLSLLHFATGPFFCSSAASRNALRGTVKNCIMYPGFFCLFRHAGGRSSGTAFRCINRYWKSYPLSKNQKISIDIYAECPHSLRQKWEFGHFFYKINQEFIYFNTFPRGQNVVCYAWSHMGIFCP